MNIEQLIRELERIKQLISTWKSEVGVPEIERGIVLDKFKQLYEEIRLGVEQADRIEPVVKPVVGEQPEPVSLEPVPSVETVPEPVFVIPPITEPHQPTPTTPLYAQSNVDQKLFNDEQVVRPRTDKQVILSLYGETAPASHSPQPVSTYQQVSDQQLSPFTSDVTSAKKVVGEVLTNGHGVPMNEALGKQTAHTDVASKLHAQSVVNDLRQSIGINDRFMLIRNLFNGNSEAYNTAINELNAFADLDNALLYMQENYQWDPDSEGVRLLVDLLERKLG